MVDQDTLDIATRCAKDIGRWNAEVKSIYSKATDALPQDALQRVDRLNRQIEEREYEMKSLRNFDLTEHPELRDMVYGMQPLGSDGPELALLRHPQAEMKSLVQRIIHSSQLRSVLQKLPSNPESKVQIERMMPIPLESAMSRVMEAKSLFVSAGTGLVPKDYTGIYDIGTFRRPLMVADLLHRSRTTSDQVSYVRMTGFTNAAAPTAEATTTSNGLKPESTVTLTEVTTNVKTIGHFLPITRRALWDIPQLEGELEEIMSYGVDEELEDQILTGSGIGENLLGILNAGIGAQAFDTNIVVTARKARTKVRVEGRAQATAYVMHPNAWEAFDLSTDNENRYYFGGPSVLGTPRLWGLPVVESEGMPTTSGLVGDWRLATLWDRMMSQVYMTDSHSDWFARNILALLVEARYAFGVRRPSAFINFALV